MNGRIEGAAMRRFLIVLVVLIGALPAAAQMRIEETAWTNPADGTEVPGLAFYDPTRARADGTLASVLFIHARRGIQPADRRYIAEIAAAGFLVLAPDWQTGRFIEPWPIPHDPATERDVALGLDALARHARARRGERRILYGYSRGGYYAVRIATGVIEPAHVAQVACIVTVAGHFQNPNAPEAAQLYGHMPEIDRLTQPILMIIGDQDFGLRIEQTARVFYRLVERGHGADLVFLPQARRAFDFREYLDDSTFTPSERAAKRYAMARAFAFMRGCAP
jgi:carboxymethylenebutenolidase